MGSHHRPEQHHHRAGRIRSMGQLIVIFNIGYHLRSQSASDSALLYIQRSHTYNGRAFACGVHSSSCMKYVYGLMTTKEKSSRRQSRKKLDLGLTRPVLGKGTSTFVVMRFEACWQKEPGKSKHERIKSKRKSRQTHTERIQERESKYYCGCCALQVQPTILRTTTYPLNLR